MIRVLLVDDERPFLELLKNSLERMGFKVKMALTGQQALDLYAKDNPEIVILDLGLPDINGREVLKEIKSSLPDLKVIIVSGHSAPSTKEELFYLGADHFIAKPIMPHKICELIKEILGK